MRLQPGGEKLAAGFRLALLEQRVGKTMRRGGVFRPQRKSPFGQRAADADIAGFGMLPAQIGEEPPILAVMAGVTLADREFRRVVIGASGEGIETERAEQQREHEGVARILVEMLL